MRREHHVFQFEEAGIEPGLVLEHVEPGGADGAVLKRRDERGIVDHAAARGIDEDRARFHFLQFRRADVIMRRRRIRHLQHDEIGLREQFVLARVLRVEPFLDVARQPVAVVVEHAHLETGRAPHDLLPDAPHADHAERGVMHVDAEHLLQVPAAPLPLAHVGFGLGKAARRREYQRPGEIRRAVVEHARRVGRHDAARAARRNVDVVVAYRDVGDDLQPRRHRQHGAVYAVGQAADDAVLVLQPLGEDHRIEGLVPLIRLDLAMFREIGERFIEDFARDENFGFHAVPVD